ncbi:MICOS complex subunit MIC27-like [Gigantopelta aegis]|uniref:MICOS complex subunit MIC27-like n=1 Tax=Gigantopelta aegis TaxID=1735272 RepID=UPI001B88DD5B|nr:MICOS complex subunit MIC27-like [Gigantopelta aegis]
MFVIMAASRVLQASRMGSVVVMAGMPFFNTTVYAVSDDKCPKPKTKTNTIKVSELPVYSDKEEDKCKFLEEDISAFRNRVSAIRQSVWEYLATVQESTTKFQQSYNDYTTRLMCYVKFVQEDPSVLPRAAVITIAGLGGLVAGFTGGKMRKLFFAATGMTAAAALCYPKQAVGTSTQVYDLVVDKVVKAADGITGTKKKGRIASAKETCDPNSDLSDHGQSNPEDKDLYTTRKK